MCFPLFQPRGVAQPTGRRRTPQHLLKLTQSLKRQQDHDLLPTRETKQELNLLQTEEQQRNQDLLENLVNARHILTFDSKL